MRRHRVVVAGLGDTGVLVASRLGDGVDVVGVATRPALVSGQELGNRLARPEHWRRNFLVPLDRFARLRAARVLHGRVERVDTTLHQVHVHRADGGRAIVPFDVLVVATGVSNGFWRHDRLEDLATTEDDMDAVTAQIAAARSIAVIGGGATGVGAAVNLARRHPRTAVHLFHPGAQPLADYHPAVRRRVTEELAAAGVHHHPEHRAVLPGGVAPDRPTSDPIEWSTGQDPFEADVVLWTVGQVRPNSAFLPADMLDNQGFVRVDDHLRVVGHPEVFAVGDVAASDPHRSSARNWGHAVVSHNVKATLRGGRGRLWRFRPPRHRWGSILGMQDDGMLLAQPTGRLVRIPRRVAEPLLFDLWLRRVLYGGVQRR
ncbi:MAG: FAD-dependent oxidoreductase [Acidimicrobiia bacterium]|nr:FAD-dependent oxidoreductase [Acidimicrobiia bacterium]